MAFAVNDALRPCVSVRLPRQNRSLQEWQHGVRDSDDVLQAVAQRAKDGSPFRKQQRSRGFLDVNSMSLRRVPASGAAGSQRGRDSRAQKFTSAASLSLSPASSLSGMISRWPFC